MDDIIIKIAADSKEFVGAITDIEESGDGLSEKLASVGQAAGLAFAGFSASIMGSVYAYRQQEQASIDVNQIIFATGGIAGVTAKAVDQLAESLENETTYSKTAVTQAEAVLLTFTNIGQQVFPEATKATADLAAGMHIGLTEAATTVGRALQDPANAANLLRRAHIQLTAAQTAQIKSMVLQGDAAGAQAIILKALEGRFDGMAQAAAGGTGVFSQVKNAMEGLTQVIGAEFAPALIAGATWLRDLINAAKENKPLVDGIAIFLATATAVTGVVAAIAGAVRAFQKLRSVFLLAQAAAAAMGTTVTVATGGLALLAVAALEIYEHWNQVWPASKALFAAFVTNIGTLCKGLAKMLIGATTLDLDLVKEGWAQAKLAVTQGVNSVTQAWVSGTKEKETAVSTAESEGRAKRRLSNLQFQKQIQTDEAAHNAALKAAQVAAEQATLLEEQHHSALLVGLKKQEAADLKILADASFQGDRTAVQAHLKEVQSLYAEAANTETQRLKLQDQINLQEIGVHNAAVVSAEKAKIALLEKMADVHYQKDKAALQAQIQQENLLITREQQKELQARQIYDKQTETITKQYHLRLTNEQKAYLKAHEQTQLTAIQTEETAQAEFLNQQVQIQTQAHNQLLQDQIQYGATYAQLNAAMHSTIYQGSKSAFGELENLTQSHNETLKSIGKAAAVANIIMKTYESAMNIFAGFSTIPIVGLGLGIAGAAAAVAFGIEQLGQVQGMAQGGLIAGGIPGIDSVPIMGQQGELVVPKQNFEQVVSSYAKSQGMLSGGNQQAQTQKVQVQIDIHPNASRVLQVKNIKDQSMGVFRGTK